MKYEHLFKRERNNSFSEQEEIDAARRALRLLRDTFHLEEEVEMSKSLTDTNVQKRIGKMIAEAARPRVPYLKLVESADN
jgi:hypothetical protein